MEVNSEKSKFSATKFNVWKRTFKLIISSVPGLTFLWGILLIIQGFIPGFTIYLTKLTIDSFMSERNNPNHSLYFNETVLFFLITGLLLLLAEALKYLTEWVRAIKAEKFSDYIKNLIHIKSAEVDLEFYESPEYHDLMEQARGESQSKPLLLLDNVGTIIQSSIVLISFGIILFSYGWAIPILLLIGAIPSLYISLKLDQIYHRWWKNTAQDRRWLMYFDAMLSHSSTAAEMRLFDLSQNFRGQYQHLRSKLRTEKMAHLNRQFWGKSLSGSLPLLTAAGSIGWIALGVFSNTASFGDLAVFYQVFSRGQLILSSLLGGVGQILSNSLYLESLFLFLDLKSKIATSEQTLKFPAVIKKGVHFNHISFRYPNETRVAISDFSLFIPTGKKIAIVGINGAGKSTLIKLLCRFYDPEAGSIEIDGIDIRNFEVKELRENISVLFQTPVQFHASVAESIALGNLNALPDMEAIMLASKQAGADAFVSKLPDKYLTLLGKWFVSGCELSGGEWQKIAVARAYFRQAPIVILDEPTSFMDSWGEADWFDRYREMLKDRTSLIVTHRFTIAMRADIIHVINDGQIIESGNHSELLKINGFYAESWRSQLAVANDAGLQVNQNKDSQVMKLDAEPLAN